MGTLLHSYSEIWAYFEKEHPDWLNPLTPGYINAPTDYWPQKVFAVFSVNAASIHEHQVIHSPGVGP